MMYRKDINLQRSYYLINDPVIAFNQIPVHSSHLLQEPLYPHPDFALGSWFFLKFFEPAFLHIVLNPGQYTLLYF